jgi:hypothetical protein
MECSVEGIEICRHIEVQHAFLSLWFVDQLFKLFQEAKLKKRIVVCHFYAAWSPTCKAAARIFQKMSIGSSNFFIHMFYGLEVR